MPNDFYTLPEVKKHARIGLLGGSFDPPHVCHALLGFSFLALEPIDELWVIPCDDHAFKSALFSFEQRFHMCKLGFKKLRNTRVLDIEQKLNKPNYSLETIKTILKLRPDLSLNLAIGSDLLQGFQQWHKPEEIVKLTKITIFEREGYPLTDIPPLLKKAQILHGFKLPDTNSTLLRKLIGNNDYNALKPFIDRKVLGYIKQQSSL